MAALNVVPHADRQLTTVGSLTASPLRMAFAVQRSRQAILFPTA
jgi:hypothetical protein